MSIFSKIIELTPFAGLSGSKMEKLSSLNPQRFYVEEVRAILGTNTFLARMVCDLAAREGLFEKRIGLTSPAGVGERILVSIAPSEEPPSEIYDEVAKAMEAQKYIFTSAECGRITFYKLAHPDE